MINIILYQPEICPNTANIIRTCSAANAKLHIIKPIAFDLHPHWLKRNAAGHFLSMKFMKLMMIFIKNMDKKIFITLQDTA